MNKISATCFVISSVILSAPSLASTLKYTINGTDQKITQFVDVEPSNHSSMELLVDFNVGTAFAGNWAFRFAVDAGLGAKGSVDGKNSDGLTKSEDLWWGGNWNNSTEILTWTGTLAAGKHNIDLLWGEDCCSGKQAGQFKIGNGDWKTLSIDNLNAAAVPAPAAAWLFAPSLLGLVGLGYRRKVA